MSDDATEVHFGLRLLGGCFRQTVQQKKKISDQASACAQREDKE